MITQLHPIEKRQHRRLPAANLHAQLKSKQGLFSNWIDLKVSDFTLFGMSFILPSEPELGKKLSLRLMLDMDMGEIKISQIEAKIVNKVLQTSGSNQEEAWRVGLIFTGQSKQSSETKKQLQPDPLSYTIVYITNTFAQIPLYTGQFNANKII